MTETAELSEKLKSEGAKILEFFSHLDDEQWGVVVYTEGEQWTIRNVLSHFVTSERGLLKLFESIRQGGAGSSEDFSIDRYNASQQVKTRELPPAELLKQYEEIRSNSAAWAANLKEQELAIRGRHPFLGETSMREMIKLLYLHNQLHLKDIKKSLK